MNDKPSINPQWNNLFLRIQAVSRQKKGVSFMNIKVITRDGIPFFWLPPEIVPLEPTMNIGMETLLETLNEKQMNVLLNAIFSGRHILG